MPDRFVIVGAGVVGRLAALLLRRRGADVLLMDENSPDGRGSCTWVGAGMLSPYCERIASEPIITQIGLLACRQWPTLLSSLAAPVHYARNGSLVVAHPRDQAELLRLRDRVIERQLPDDAMREVDTHAIAELEPELGGRFSRGLFFPLEGHLDNRELLAALLETAQREGARARFNARVEAVEPGRVVADGETLTADWVFDCRGLGARTDLADLRGVRGEVVLIDAPDVTLNRPVRMMHPRYSIYVVPRRAHRYLIGATQIESEDNGPVTVRSALELLSAAFSLHSGFAEARILETAAACRPAFPDNLPRLSAEPGLVRINGLYRHGFLLAPPLVESAVSIALDGAVAEAIQPLWKIAV